MQNISAYTEWKGNAVCWLVEVSWSSEKEIVLDRLMASWRLWTQRENVVTTSHIPYIVRSVGEMDLAGAGKPLRSIPRKMTPPVPLNYKIPPITPLARRRSERSAMPDVDEKSQYECLLIIDNVFIVLVSLPP